MEEKLPEIYSEEVQDILSRPPHKIIRVGIMIMSIVIFAILVASWFIRYPDTISAEVSITSVNIPAALIAKSTGKITHLMVRNGDLIKPGTVTAVIENPARYEDVMYLDSVLNRFNADNDSTGELIAESHPLLLGDLQAAFREFQKNCYDYHLFLSVNFLAQKISSLRKQLETTGVYYNRVLMQSNLQAEEMEIARTEFRRDSLLFKQGVLSPAEFDKSKSTLLQHKQTYEQAKTSLTSIQLQKLQMEQQIIENELTLNEQTRQLKQNISQSYNTLRNNLNTWKQTYLLISPVEGKVTFTGMREINQNIVAGDVIMTIVPVKKSEIVGTIILPMRGAGKVKSGQEVNVKFDNYPYMEFGMVKARIRTISLVPKESNYILEIVFPNGLHTNYGRELTFTQEMKGNAEIITEDLRLIERLIAPIRSILKERL